MFDTTKEDLKDILRKVDEGKLQLPDFQRNDDFAAFCTARQVALEELIAGAMQKPVVLEASTNESDDDSVDDTEEEVVA